MRSPNPNTYITERDPRHLSCKAARAPTWSSAQACVNMQDEDGQLEGTERLEELHHKLAPTALVTVTCPRITEVEAHAVRRGASSGRPLCGLCSDAIPRVLA